MTFALKTLDGFVRDSKIQPYEGEVQETALLRTSLKKQMKESRKFSIVSASGSKGKSWNPVD